MGSVGHGFGQLWWRVELSLEPSILKLYIISLNLNTEAYVDLRVGIRVPRITIRHSENQCNC